MQLFKIVTFIFVILGHIYGAPSTNAVDEIERFLKSDVAHFYGMCDKALEITQLSSDVYNVTTLEINQDTNTTVKLCMTTLKIAASGYVGGILYMTCESSRLGHGGHLLDDRYAHDELKNYFTKMVTENYPSACLVDDVLEPTKKNLWSTLFYFPFERVVAPEYQTMELKMKPNLAPGNFELSSNKYLYSKILNAVVIDKVIENVYVTGLNIKVFNKWTEKYSMKNGKFAHWYNKPRLVTCGVNGTC